MSEIKHPDPTALGLFGLAMVTLVASTQKMGFTNETALILPWAIFLGAFAQLIAGILDYKKGNIFGGTAFCAYGFFWLAVAMSWFIVSGAFGEILQSKADINQLTTAFLGYLIFTLYMTVAAATTNRVLFAIFILIDLLFLGLTLSGFGIFKHFFHGIASWAEFLIAMFSFYGSAANIFKNHFGQEILPVGKPFKIFIKN